VETNAHDSSTLLLQIVSPNQDHIFRIDRASQRRSHRLLLYLTHIVITLLFIFTHSIDADQIGLNLKSSQNRDPQAVKPVTSGGKLQCITEGSSEGVETEVKEGGNEGGDLANLICQALQTPALKDRCQESREPHRNYKGIPQPKPKTHIKTAGVSKQRSTSGAKEQTTTDLQQPTTGTALRKRPEQSTAREIQTTIGGLQIYTISEGGPHQNSEGSTTAAKPIDLKLPTTNT
jgi:hypothetical protein